MRRGILVGLAALLLAGAPALAEERTRSYGGSGADRLTRLIEYGDGLIAVGRTDSRNARAFFCAAACSTRMLCVYASPSG